ncbi:arylamine N-acetyltransferase [Desmospora profundinema]|uniref:Arylamine N-acetyltransferase n=1 Tax=Desmospora profundinema TaxID=1571184 RepID=A0ABU1IQQ5_9BACL|nr:arylamine N-acetyltransferase [Desmospora profundinema]MDR6226259.1 arylamine N-acetyltransferase [Desmospora profundinema]
MWGSPSWLENYLDLLQLEREEASFAYLEQICRRHLAVFPFENAGKLIDHHEGRFPSRLVPSMEEFLERHRAQQLGGTCYILNSHLFRLLRALGFDCRLLPVGESHVAILVRLPDLGGERVYVDVGSASPLYRPVRFETEPQNRTGFGGYEVRLRPVEDGEGRWRYTRHIDGRLGEPIWTFDPDTTVSSIQSFSKAIYRSYQPDGAFMTILRCQVWQWERSRSLSLVNNRFSIRHQDGAVEKRTLADRKAIRQVMEEEFGYPDFPSGRVMDILEERGVSVFPKSDTA